MDKQQFFNGAVFDAWRWFGAHLGGGGAVFRTFAPNASRITLTGAMNGWTETDLHQDGRSGFWEVSVPGTQAGQLYKYRIYAADGSVTEHCDPYGFAMELCAAASTPRARLRSWPTSRNTGSRTTHGCRRVPPTRTLR